MTYPLYAAAIEWLGPGAERLHPETVGLVLARLHEAKKGEE